MPSSAGLPTYGNLTPEALADSARPGVSWGAVFAGAAGAAALSLILLILGTGLGLSSVSPWTGQGVSGTTFGVSTVIWLTLTQLAASGLGGYLAGRLRTKWQGVHTDEVYFRDTAHGFLAWSVATLVTAAVLGSAIGSVLSSGVKAGASVAGGVATTAVAGAAAAGTSAVKNDESSGSGSSMGYFVDSLFRKDPAATPAGAGLPDISPAASGAEVSRIFANAISTGTLSAPDTRYVGQVVAARTGLSQADAEARVKTTFDTLQTKLKQAETAARDAADKARKASAGAALWLFVSLLIGAFGASLAATYGGRQRDL
ncbi:MAG: hypothetical protein M3Y32_00205 [Pseudomonadota bacterium]|nr:hypothetical protein [Pseudomonadota bacterium]